MVFKSEKLARLNYKFKELLNSFGGSQVEEAESCGVSTSVMNDYCNFSRPDKNMPVGVALRHSQARLIATWFCQQLGGHAVFDSVDPARLNGSTDDEHLDIIAELMHIREELRTSRSPQMIAKALQRIGEIRVLVAQAETEIINLIK
ncbi:MAG: hypothetical protein ABIA75_01445 [Candidatus Neomarinimicrobiota bacterium]